MQRPKKILCPGMLFTLITVYQQHFKLSCLKFPLLPIFVIPLIFKGFKLRFKGIPYISYMFFLNLCFSIHPTPYFKNFISFL